MRGLMAIAPVSRGDSNAEECFARDRSDVLRRRSMLLLTALMWMPLPSAVTAWAQNTSGQPITSQAPSHRSLSNKAITGAGYENLPKPGRDNAFWMTVNHYGITATLQTLGSSAGSAIMEKGGNAIDAIIAANAAVGVLEPMMNGMGGDLFAIYWDNKAKKLYALNSSGWTARAETIDALSSALGRGGIFLKNLDIPDQTLWRTDHWRDRCPCASRDGKRDPS